MAWTLASFVALALCFGDVRAAAPKDCTGSAEAPAQTGDKAGMVFIPGGSFIMGSDREHPEERFSHEVRVDGFWIDLHEVTNAEFAEFVKATGYVTLAERGLDRKTHPNLTEDLAAPGSVMFVQPVRLDRGGDITQWWQYKGRRWLRGAGSRSRARTITRSCMSPTRTRLPTPNGAAGNFRPRRSGNMPRAAAAKSARSGARHSMRTASRSPIAGKVSSRSITPSRTAMRTSAGRLLPAQRVRLHDMIGNALGVTADWYVPSHAREAALNPSGPSMLELHVAAGQAASKVIKGGSYLCASNYCSRYRATARQPQEVDLSAGHLGFRTVLNKPRE
jgi:formylglycine-generating enzyme required for sulfatase activity